MSSTNSTSMTERLGGGVCEPGKRKHFTCKRFVLQFTLDT